MQYKFTGSYTSSLVTARYNAGDVIDLTDEQAADILRDCPGIIVPEGLPAMPLADKPKRTRKRKAKPSATRQVTEPGGDR